MQSKVLIASDDVSISEVLTSPLPEDVASSGVHDRVSPPEVSRRNLSLESDRLPVKKKQIAVSPAGVP